MTKDLDQEAEEMRKEAIEATRELLGCLVPVFIILSVLSFGVAALLYSRYAQ